MARPKKSILPNEESPVWSRAAPILLAFLQEPHTWKEMTEWRKQKKWTEPFLRSCLCWLEHQKEIFHSGSGDALVWVASSPENWEAVQQPKKKRRRRKKAGKKK